MARLTYGADTQGPTILAGRFIGLQLLSFWTSAAMSTQITDLVPSTITTLTDGTVPQFQGPASGQGSSTTPGMWVFGGGAEPLFYNPQGTNAAGTPVTLTDNGDGTATLVVG